MGCLRLDILEQDYKHSEHKMFAIKNSLTKNKTNLNVCTKYLYGMNGQEHEDEIAEGVYTAQFWEYDSRIGRRWNLDPKPITGVSDYACFANNPVLLSDVNGDCAHGEGCTCGGGVEPSPAGLFLDASLSLGASIYNTVQRLKEYGEVLPTSFTVNRMETQYTEDGGIIGNRIVTIPKFEITPAEEGFGAVLDVVSLIPGKPSAQGAKAMLFTRPVLTKPVVVNAVKGAIHHVATNKNKLAGEKWTLKFESLFSKAGININSKLNKVFVEGHYGPHPAEYHKAIFTRLLEATEGLKGKDYIKAFEKTLDVLGKEVSTKGTELNKLLTK
jgi:hypothetical protein